MKNVITYFAVFIIVYLIYLLFVVKRKKANEKLKKSLEVRFLINRYQIDIENINIKSLSNKIALCNSFIIATTFIIVLFVKHFILKMLLGFVVLFPLILISYHILAKSLLKKEGK